jgi:hypothetical protein
MKENHYRSEDQLIKDAIDILMEKLGPVETMRFLSLPAKKRVESLKRHRAWQSNLDKDAFFKDTFDN